jgi:hypothetical protein
LTPEPPDERDSVLRFLADTHIPWPNGYGAGATMEALGIQVVPTVLVVDRKGTIVWQSGSSGTLDQAIERALASP